MHSLARPVLRSPAFRHFAQRRFESTATQKATEAAKQATEAAKQTTAKAAEGLSRVTSAAGPAIAGAARGVGNTLTKLGGRTAKFVAFVERQSPLVVYYSKVGLELGKFVFHNQKMTLPSAATFQTFYQNAWNSIRTGSIFSSPQNLLNTVRNLTTVQLATGGVVLAEVLGFFTVGEMIGRMKLVGYHGETGSHH